MRWLCGDAPRAEYSSDADDDDDSEGDDLSSIAQHRDTVTPAGNPLPDPVHLTVISTDTTTNTTTTTSSNPNALRWLNPRGRLVLVGDVHGCVGALRRLLREAAFEPGRDNLVLCGDAVTKGPDSLAVIDEVMRLGGLCVRGNHDDLALAEAESRAAATAGGRSDQQPQQQQQQQQQQQPSPDYIPGLTDKHRHWLASLPFTIRFPQYRATAVHAGLVPGVARRGQALRDVTRMRELVPLQDDEDDEDDKDDEDEEEDDAKGLRGKLKQLRQQKKKRRRRWRAVEGHVDGSVPWAPEWRGPGHVFFGHDAALGLQLRRGATGLDTGCVYGGRLSCAVLPSLEELGQSMVRRRRRGAWWRIWQRLFGGGAQEGDRAGARLPRTPRLDRDLHGRIVSVPS